MENGRYICIKNPNETVHPGEVLDGEVVLTLYKTRKFNGIHVLISGCSETEWKGREKREVNGTTKRTTEHYKGKKVYFEVMVDLVQQPVELEAGTYHFDFNYTLPDQLPPTIKGAHGHCTYTIKAVFDRPWRPNECIKKNFIVDTIHMFAMHMLAPAYEESLEELWCLPFKVAPFKLSVEVGQSAFQVGDGIPVGVQIEHDSNTTIFELKIQLRQVLQFYSQRPTRKAKEEFVKVLDIRCKVMDSRRIGKFQRVLQVPAHMPVTYASIAELVAIAYEVRVEVKVGGLNKNPIVRIPVIIGTGINSYSTEERSFMGTDDGHSSSNHHRNIGFDLTHSGSVGGGGGANNHSYLSTLSQQQQPQQHMDDDDTCAPPSYQDAIILNSPSASTSSTITVPTAVPVKFATSPTPQAHV